VGEVLVWLTWIFLRVCLCVCQDFEKKLVDLKTAMDNRISKVSTI